MRGHFDCDSGTAFASIIDHMRRRQTVLGSNAIFRGQSSSSWPLQSLWERWFLHPQPAGLMEPYYVQPHDGERITLQRALLEEFRREVELALPQEAGRSDDQLWALGRHHGLVTPLLDWTLDPYTALYFALHRSVGVEPGVEPAAVWVFHGSQASPYGRIWDEAVFPKIDAGYVSARQRAQQGVFTRLSHPIFGDLEEYLRNELGKQNVPVCLVKVEILPSAVRHLLEEIAARGINEASLGFTGERDNQQLNDIAERCNAKLKAEHQRPPAPPTPPKADQKVIDEAAKRVAERWITAIGSGEARVTGHKAFPFLRPPSPRPPPPSP